MKFVYIVMIRFSARGTLFTQTSIKVRRLTGGLFIFFFEKQRNERNRAALIITSPLTSYEDLKLRVSMTGDQWASWQNVLEFTVRSSRAPGHLSSRSVWIACFRLARKNFFWLISEEKQPSDSRGFLHDVDFLIDRHSCLARSTGEVCWGKFQNKMLTTRKNYKL